MRTARLTPRGLDERAELDRRNDAVASSILEPLGDAQRERLVGAMAEVERLLVASMVPSGRAIPATRGAVLPDAYFAELGARFDHGFDVGRAPPTAPPTSFRRTGLLLVATLAGEPVGCGVLRHHALQTGVPGWSEIKRMWVSPCVRGIGLGRRLLASSSTAPRPRASPSCGSTRTAC